MTRRKLSSESPPPWFPPICICAHTGHLPPLLRVNCLCSNALPLDMLSSLGFQSASCLASPVSLLGSCQCCWVLTFGETSIYPFIHPLISSVHLVLWHWMPRSCSMCGEGTLKLVSWHQTWTLNSRFVYPTASKTFPQGYLTTRPNSWSVLLILLNPHKTCSCDSLHVSVNWTPSF